MPPHARNSKCAAVRRRLDGGKDEIVHMYLTDTNRNQFFWESRLYSACHTRQSADSYRWHRLRAWENWRRKQPCIHPVALLLSLGNIMVNWSQESGQSVDKAYSSLAQQTGWFGITSHLRSQHSPLRWEFHTSIIVILEIVDAYRCLNLPQLLIQQWLEISSCHHNALE